MLQTICDKYDINTNAIWKMLKFSNMTVTTFRNFLFCLNKEFDIHYKHQTMLVLTFLANFLLLHSHFHVKTIIVFIFSSHEKFHEIQKIFNISLRHLRVISKSLLLQTEKYPKLKPFKFIAELLRRKCLSKEVSKRKSRRRNRNLLGSD